MHIFSWNDAFHDIGAIYENFDPPDLSRPFAALTTKTHDGRIRMTDRFFNGSIVQSEARVFVEACDDLARIFLNSLRESETFCCGKRCNKYVIAAAEGGIAMSVCIANALSVRIGERVRALYAVKKNGGFVFERNMIECPAACLPVEDAITTGTTVKKLMIAAQEACVGGTCRFAPRTLALCRRLGPGRPAVDRRIISLIELPAREWAEGENPYTGGPELVEPVRPKLNWPALMRA